MSDGDIIKIPQLETMSEDKYKAAIKKIGKLKAYLSSLKSHMCEVAELEVLLEEDDNSSKDKDYYAAKITVEEYEIDFIQDVLIAMYEDMIPGFMIKKLEKESLIELSKACGINEELLGPVDKMEDDIAEEIGGIGDELMGPVDK